MKGSSVDYLTYKNLPEIQNINQGIISSLHIHKSKIKIRLFNTNEEFASIPALYTKNLALQQTLQGYKNITQSQTDYQNGKYSGSRKVDLIINPIAEPNIIELLALLEFHNIKHSKKLIAKLRNNSSKGNI